MQNLQPHHSRSLKELPVSRNFLSYESFFLMKKLSELKPGCTAEAVFGRQGPHYLLLSQYLLFSTEVRKDFLTSALWILTHSRQEAGAEQRPSGKKQCV